MLSAAEVGHSLRKWWMYLSTVLRLSRLVRSKTTIAPWQPLKYCLVSAKNVSCPVVSQICSLQGVLSTCKVIDLSSIPTVAQVPSGLYTSSTNRIKRLVLPELGAPSKMTLYVRSKPWKWSIFELLCDAASVCLKSVFSLTSAAKIIV